MEAVLSIKKQYFFNNNSGFSAETIALMKRQRAVELFVLAADVTRYFEEIDINFFVLRSAKSRIKKGKKYLCTSLNERCKLSVDKGSFDTMSNLVETYLDETDDDSEASRQRKPKKKDKAPTIISSSSAAVEEVQSKVPQAVDAVVARNGRVRKQTIRFDAGEEETETFQKIKTRTRAPRIRASVRSEALTVPEETWHVRFRKSVEPILVDVETDFVNFCKQLETQEPNNIETKGRRSKRSNETANLATSQDDREKAISLFQQELQEKLLAKVMTVVKEHTLMLTEKHFAKDSIPLSSSSSIPAVAEIGQQK